MTALTDPTASSPLNPTDMCAPPTLSKTNDSIVEPVTNGQSKHSKPKNEDKASNATQSEQDSAPGAAADGEKGDGSVSRKELKSKQKAEKQAKRAAQKAAQGAQELEKSQQQQQHTQQSSAGQRRLSNTGKAQVGQGAKITDMTTHHRRTADSSARSLPVRPTAALMAQGKETWGEKKPVQEKRVTMFSHLYSKDRRSTVAGVGREIHPAVLTLGIQLRDYVICGGNARCVATLLAFKKVIQSYATPPSVALPRHLTTHLSHQISYLSSSRPLSTSQGNSIRWLKKLVVELDPKISDPDARD